MAMKRKTLAYWVCQIAGWMGHAGTNYFFTSLYMPLTPAQRLRYAELFFCGAVSAIVATHLYRTWIHRHGWTQLKVTQLIPRVLLASMVLGALITGLVTAEWAMILGVESFAPTRIWLPQALIGWTITSLGWNVIYFAVSYYDRYRSTQLEKARLETVAKEAQLLGPGLPGQPAFHVQLSEQPARAYQRESGESPANGYGPRRSAALCLAIR